MKYYKEPIHQDMFAVKPNYEFKNPLFELEHTEIFEIRGPNGSGKSTIPKMLIDNDPKAFIVTNKGNAELTVCPTFKTVLVGSYDVNANCGGCDRICRNENIILAIVHAYEYVRSTTEYSGFRILYEGIMPSTTNFGIIKPLFEHHGFDKRLFNVLFMDTPLDLCLQRIYSRNGNKSINEDNIVKKHRQVSNQPETLLKEYPEVKQWSVPNTSSSKEDLLEAWIEFKFPKIN